MNAKSSKRAKGNLKVVRDIKFERPKRMDLSAEESLEKMNDFDKRKDKFIASIRKSKD